MTVLARRALEFLFEPQGEEAHSRGQLAVAVVGLSEACGVSTIARGLALELPRDQVADGLWPDASGVIVAVADGSGVPVLARLVAERLAERRPREVLVANRPADPADWVKAGALCVPGSRLGVLLLAHGRRARGAMGAGLREIARAVHEAAA